MLNIDLFAAYLSERFQEYLPVDIVLEAVVIRDADKTILIKERDLRGTMTVSINQFYRSYQVDEDLETYASMFAGALTMAVEKQKAIEHGTLHKKFNENHIALVPKEANEEAFKDENITRLVINGKTLPFTYQMMMFDKLDNLIGFTPIKNNDMALYNNLAPYLYIKAKNNTVDLLNITCKSYAEIKEDTALYEELSELKELEEKHPNLNLDSLHLISVDLNDFTPILNLEMSTYRKLSEKLNADLVLMFKEDGRSIYVVPYTGKDSVSLYLDFLAETPNIYFYDRDTDALHDLFKEINDHED